MSEPVTGIAGWVTTKEAARLLNVTPEAIRQRIFRHRIPTLKVGSVLLVSLERIKLYGAE